MNKNEFLQTLEAALADFKEEERKEILYDYEEHFRIGKDSGKSEEELIQELGNPKDIANQYRMENEPEINFIQGEKVIANEKREEKIPVGISIVTAIALAFFNLVFIIGPYVGIAAAIIGLFAGAVGMSIGGLGVTIAGILSPLFPDFISAPSGLVLIGIALVGIGITALGLLWLIGMCYLVKYFCIGTVKYIKWNIRVIRR